MLKYLFCDRFSFVNKKKTIDLYKFNKWSLELSVFGHLHFFFFSVYVVLCILTLDVERCKTEFDSNYNIMMEND